MAASEFCVGEKIVSLRELLKTCRSVGSYGLFPAPTNFASGFMANAYSIVAPTIENAANPRVLATQLFAVDYISCFGMMYAFKRGGVRLKVISTSSPSIMYATMLYYPSNTIV